VIIVDNVAENFQNQPDNGIFIRSWFDDMTDTALEELGPLLKEIVRKQVPDVRVALRRFRDQMIEQLEKGIANPIMSLDWFNRINWNIINMLKQYIQDYLYKRKWLHIKETTIEGKEEQKLLKLHNNAKF